MGPSAEKPRLKTIKKYKKEIFVTCQKACAISLMLNKVRHELH